MRDELNPGRPFRPRLSRAARRVGEASERHRPRIGTIRTAQDLHQRTLAGAILADQRVYLALAQLEIDAVERHRWAKGFGDLR